MGPVRNSSLKPRLRGSDMFSMFVVVLICAPIAFVLAGMVIGNR